MSANENILLLILESADRLKAAQTLEERQATERRHIEGLSIIMAETIFTAVHGTLHITPDDAVTATENTLFIVEQSASRAFEAHDLGASVLPESECQHLARATFLRRLFELHAVCGDGGAA